MGIQICQTANPISLFFTKVVASFVSNQDRLDTDN